MIKKLPSKCPPEKEAETGVYPANVHFPEYRSPDGILHLHVCARGHRGRTPKDSCVENTSGDCSSPKDWLKNHPPKE